MGEVAIVALGGRSRDREIAPTGRSRDREIAPTVAFAAPLGLRETLHRLPSLNPINPASDNYRLLLTAILLTTDN